IEAPRTGIVEFRPLSARASAAWRLRVQAVPEVVPMRAAGFALVALTTNLALMAACGGSPPPSQTAATPAAAGADTSGAAAPGDAGPAPSTGPASTTTQTLGAGGLGTKLTPLAADAGAEGGVKHHAELGRSVADLKAIVGSHRDEARACYDSAL